MRHTRGVDIVLEFSDLSCTLIFRSSFDEGVEEGKKLHRRASSKKGNRIDPMRLGFVVLVRFHYVLRERGFEVPFWLDRIARGTSTGGIKSKTPGIYRKSSQSKEKLQFVAAGVDILDRG